MVPGWSRLWSRGVPGRGTGTIPTVIPGWSRGDLDRGPGRGPRAIPGWSRGGRGRSAPWGSAHPRRLRLRARSAPRCAGQQPRASRGAGAASGPDTARAVPGRAQGPARAVPGRARGARSLPRVPPADAHTLWICFQSVSRVLEMLRVLFLLIVFHFSLVNHWRAVTSSRHPAEDARSPHRRGPAPSAGLPGLIRALQVRGCAGGAVSCLWRKEPAAVSIAVMFSTSAAAGTAQRSHFAAPHSRALPLHLRGVCASIFLWISFFLPFPSEFMGSALRRGDHPQV